MAAMNVQVVSRFKMADNADHEAAPGEPRRIVNY
jgi:hypothetical protein